MDLKTQILEALREQRKLEVTARDAYLKLQQEVNDGGIREDVGHVIKEEIEHIRVVDSLIAVINEYPKPIGERAEKAINERFNWQSDGTNALLFISSIDRHILDIMSFIRENPTRSIVYVSYNKIPKYTKKVFKDHGIDLGNITFITCAEQEDKTDITVSPTDLTKLSIQILESMNGAGANPIIIFDTVSGLSMNYETNTIAHFVAAINNRAREKDSVALWIAMDEPEEKALNAKIAQFCDRTVRAN